MRFYYFSVISAAFAAVVSAIALGIFWLFWTKGQGRRLTPVVALISTVAFFALPWSEELWIAFRFGSMCTTDGGIFINKTVAADGFYDATTHWWRQLVESKYQFVESRDYIDKTIWRVERVGSEIRHFKIDRPTARYRYEQLHSHTSVAYKVRKAEWTVTDSQTDEVLARETVYVRDPYWFFIALDRPVMICRGVDQRSPQSGGSIYNAVLKPITKQ